MTTRKTRPKSEVPEPGSMLATPATKPEATRNNAVAKATEPSTPPRTKRRRPFVL
jgi:hypothetical protein